ncbi:MAG: lytic transglycosylase domain-containing protein [Acidobacteriales bacterium]|nr:lytic transglycosylase domain-containing protein [Terriglobales bacterium]
MRPIASVLILTASAALAQEPKDPYDAIRAAMEASIAKQHASVRSQVKATDAARDYFFTVPWPRPAVQYAASGGGEEPGCEPLPKALIGPYIEGLAEREGLTPDLLRAVIDKESGYRPCVVSKKGAMGLMQLMPTTAAEFGVKNPFDPVENLDAGARLLKRLVKRYGGDLALVLGAYNAGSSRVDSAGGIPKIPETVDYVSDILEKLETQ